MRRQTLYAIGLIVLLILTTLQLVDLPNRAAPSEIQAINNARSIQSISDNPLFLPYKLAVFVVVSFFDSVHAVRAISVAIFGLAVVALYRVIKRWHGDKSALFTTILFATSAYGLAVARLAEPLVMLLCWPIIIALLLWLQHGKSKLVAPFSLVVISAGLLYVPGAPYFFLLLFVMFSTHIKDTLRKVTTKSILIGIVFGVLIASPLLMSFAQNTSLIRDWLLVPQNIQWSDIAQNILRVPSAFIYRAPIDPLLNVGRLPLLDVASGGLLLIGLYAYRKNTKLERTKIFIIIGFFALIIGALGALTPAIIILLPFVYALIAAGISYLIDQWYAVFPKNPFARSFGLVLVVCIVAASSFYQLNRFLVVWPQTPETRALYTESRLIQ